MKLANLDGRLVLVVADGVVDVATASNDRFGPDPMSAFDDWAAFTEFARGAASATGRLREADLRCPVPNPRQVFAIGLNYRSHADETGMAVPEVPATFTKFPRRWRARSTTSRSSGRASTGRSNSSPSSGPGPTAWPNPTRGGTSPA